jgi:DUF4097 and DUF4098 domain-containing protein YvlB
MPMEKLRFQTGQRLELHLRYAGGDAAVKGWDEAMVEVTLDGSLDQCTAEQEGDTLTIESHVPLSIAVPMEAVVRVGRVSGDLLLQHLDGEVSIEDASGDVSWRSGKAALSLQEVHGRLAVDHLDGPLSVGQAHADVLLTRVLSADLGVVHGGVHARGMGELKAGSVSGDVQASEISGPVALEEGRGDFRGKDLTGGMDLRRVRGDLWLKTPLTPGMSYRAQADGSIVARFPEDVSARFDLQAKGSISAQLPQVEKQETGIVIGQAGNGEAVVELRANGHLSVRLRQQVGNGEAETGASWGSLAAQIEAEIAEHLGKMDIDAVTRRAIDKATRKAEEEVRHAEHRWEKEARRVEERARRASERAARAADRAQTRTGRHAHRWGFPFSSGASSPASAGARSVHVSADDQLSVLKMLQEGKISVEQAENLLKALES